MSRPVPFLTEDPSTLDLLKMVGKIAPTDVPVLVLGESGTGKELIARQIHDLSKRANQPMVSLNCGAIQETLLLSELFGHEKGAFTGATSQKRGLVELANGGTLFLDEIGEMGLEAQSKLLRFLQEGEMYRVGGKTAIQVNVRLVSATNRSLENQIKAGKFREDLFYRINTFTVKINPLRKRPTDIPLLIQKFLLEESSSNTGAAPLKAISPRALELLQKYSWPGNVRELQNTMERFRILCEDTTLNEDDIPLTIRNPMLESENDEPPTIFLLETIERNHILRVLAHFKGNKTKAAGAMGITVKTLYNKLAYYQTLSSATATDADRGASAPAAAH